MVGLHLFLWIKSPQKTRAVLIEIPSNEPMLLAADCRLKHSGVLLMTTGFCAMHILWLSSERVLCSTFILFPLLNPTLMGAYNFQTI
jgi:hypothetical protein